MENNRERKRVILIIEDDPDIQTLLRTVLKEGSFSPVICSKGVQGINKIREKKPDIVILDINLPDISGWDVLRIIKQDEKIANIPVIILTGFCKGVLDTVRGLEEGADDYILKPFSPRVLLARIKAILRRSTNGSMPVTSNVVLSPGGEITIDTQERKVYLNLPNNRKKEVILTNKEFELLKLFLENPYKVLSRKYIYELVWEQEFFGSTRTVDKHVERLRFKLGIYGKWIETVVGVGYRFSPPSKEK